jgi:hypothetical protein
VAEPISVAGWGTTVYRRIDFSSIDVPGEYRIEVDVDGETVRSAPFLIGQHRLRSVVVSDATAYFRSMRSSGEIDRKDANAHFYGDNSARTVDAHGGWLDASGDYSKFLSHLTYTRMMSPQQIPLCAWAMMAALDELCMSHPTFETSQHARLRDEGLFGADFLVRFQSPDGYFYTGIFDALTKDLGERVVTAPLQDSVRTQRWQAAYRHGGGMAIAALARASTLEDHGDFGSAEYFAAAEHGFHHLEAHNREYLFDGEESVIDDYCALLAATELLRASAVHGGDAGRFRAAAERRAGTLKGRMRLDHDGRSYLLGDVEGRPYFHAAEAGLPMIALMRFADVYGDGAQAQDAHAGVGLAVEARECAIELMRGVVSRVDGVPNPFGYLRQRVQPTDVGPRDAFFYPHQNETGYWWQGENATISSVAYAATRAAGLDACEPELRDRLLRLADDLLAWVTGLNPFDTCMLQGRGRNNAEYLSVYQNSPGGILNGITSGFDDEDAIAFLPDVSHAAGNEWRWAEQWIPHSAWFLLAVCASR